MAAIGVVTLPKEAVGVVPTGCLARVSETLPGAINRVVEVIRPRMIILFGSYAYGAPTPDSDVDLLVVMETDAPHAQRYVTVSQVLWPRQFPVDILVRTPKEIEEALTANDPFINEIVGRGQVLYEQPE
jgi:uncharacterized protein